MSKEFSAESGAALAAEAGPTIKDQFSHLPLAMLEASLTNPRKNFHQGKLGELADSIKASGVHQPILVRPLPGTRLAETFGFRRKGEPLPTHEIVSGERRYRASLIAGAATIPALIRPLTDDQVLEIQLVENLQRDDLTELEEAEGYERLMQHNSITAEAVGDKIGKSRSYVYARLKLLDLCIEAKTALRDGTIDASRALLIARIPDGQLQAKALAYATTKSGYRDEVPGVRDLQSWLQQNVMLRLERAPFQIADANLVEAAGSCKVCPKRTGANPDLFADVEGADICTDPACYQGKEAAHRLAIVSKAEAKGMTVIDGAAAKKICTQHNSQLKGYSLLSQQRDDAATPGKLGKLLGKDAPAPVLIENPWTKELIEAVPTDEAEAVLLAKGLIKATTSAVRQQSELDNEVGYLKALKTRTERKARADIFAALHDAIRSLPEAKAAGLISAALLRPWLLDRLDDLDHEDTAIVLQVELDATNYSTTEQTAARLRLQACDSATLYRALALYIMLDDRAAGYDADSKHPLFDAIAEQTGTNLHAIRKQAAKAVQDETSDAIRKLKEEHKAAQKAAQPTAPLAQPPASPTAGAKPKKPAKPGPARKLSADEAKSGIAAAMQANEGVPATGTHTAPVTAWPFPTATTAEAAPAEAVQTASAFFAEGQQVSVLSKDRLRPCMALFAGKPGVVMHQQETTGEGSWMVRLDGRKGRTGGDRVFLTEELEVVS